MIILAKALKGQEYLYNAKSAHRVSIAAAETIKDVLNATSYHLKPGEVWHIFNVDHYDNAFVYASEQAFTRRNGIIKETYTGY